MDFGEDDDSVGSADEHPRRGSSNALPPVPGALSAPAPAPSPAPVSNWLTAFGRRRRTQKANSRSVPVTAPAPANAAVPGERSGASTDRTPANEYSYSLKTGVSANAQTSAGKPQAQVPQSPPFAFPNPQVPVPSFPCPLALHPKHLSDV